MNYSRPAQCAGSRWATAYMTDGGERDREGGDGGGEQQAREGTRETRGDGERVREGEGGEGGERAGADSGRCIVRRSRGHERSLRVWEPRCSQSLDTLLWSSLLPVFSSLRDRDESQTLQRVGQR